MVAAAREPGYSDVAIAIERRHGDNCSAYGRSLWIGMLGVIKQEPLVAPQRNFHLHREVGARIDGVGHSVGVGNLIHLHLVQHHFDARAGATLRIFHEDKLAALAVRKLAEQLVVAGVVLVHVVPDFIHAACCCDGWLSSHLANAAVPK